MFCTNSLNIQNNKLQDGMEREIINSQSRNQQQLQEEDILAGFSQVEREDEVIIGEESRNYLFENDFFNNEGKYNDQVQYNPSDYNTNAIPLTQNKAKKYENAQQQKIPNHEQINEIYLGQESRYQDNNNKWEQEEANYCDDQFELRMVNEILDFEEQRFQPSSSNQFNSLPVHLSQKPQQQNEWLMDTNLIDFGQKLGSSTVKNLFEDSNRDLLGAMSKIENTEENNILLNQLSNLNNTIKEIEQAIQKREVKKPPIKSIKPCQLKDQLSSNTFYLKNLTKDLIKYNLFELFPPKIDFKRLESDREKQRQSEGEIMKEIENKFQKDSSLLIQSLRKVEQLKEEMTSSIEKEQENYNCLQERKSSGKEELMGKLVQRAEMVAEMEDYEEVRDDFVSKFPLEAKSILQALELTEDIQNLKVRQNEITSIQNKKCKKQKHQKVSSKNNQFDESDPLEKMISDKLAEMGYIHEEGGVSLFVNIFQDKSLTLQKQVTEKQIELIEQEQRKLENLQKQSYIEEKGLNNHNENHQKNRNTSCSSSSSLYSSPSSQENQLENNGSFLSLENLQARSQLLKQWKEKAQDHINSIDAHNKSSFLDLDRPLLEGLIEKHLQSLRIKFVAGDIAFLGDLYEQYFEKLSQSYQQKGCAFQQNISEKYDLKSLEEEQFQIEQKLQEKELLVSQKMTIIQSVLLQQTEEAFQAYMKEQKDVFDGIESNYGSKALQQIRHNHYVQFHEIMSKKQQKMISNLEEVRNGVNQMNKRVQNNINYVENTLSQDLSNIQSDIQLSQAKIQELQSDLSVINQKHRQYLEQLKELHNHKQNTISSSIEGSDINLSSRTYERKKVKLQNKIKESEEKISQIEIELKESFFHEIEETVENTEKQLNSSNSSLERKLDEMLIQRFALESRLIEINFDIKPNLSANCEEEEDSRVINNKTISPKINQQPQREEFNLTLQEKDSSKVLKERRDSLQAILEEINQKRDNNFKFNQNNEYSTLPQCRNIQQQPQQQSINQKTQQFKEYNVSQEEEYSNKAFQPPNFQVQKHQRARSVLLESSGMCLQDLNISQVKNQDYQQQINSTVNFSQENLCPNSSYLQTKSKQFQTYQNNQLPKKLQIAPSIDTCSSFFTPNATPNTLHFPLNNYTQSTINQFSSINPPRFQNMTQLIAPSKMTQQQQQQQSFHNSKQIYKQHCQSILNGSNYLEEASQKRSIVTRVHPRSRRSKSDQMKSHMITSLIDNSFQANNDSSQIRPIQKRQVAFKFHLDSLKSVEAQFLLQIKELLQGSFILKKFSQNPSMKQNVFNPFTSDTVPPELCGYGQRIMILNKNLTKIEIRHPLKPTMQESSIPIEQVLRNVIPQTTNELIKCQKNLNISINLKAETLNPTKMKMQSIEQEGVQSLSYYSFCIVLDKGGRLEFIAEDYRTFMAWTQGIDLLIKLRKQLPRLKNHIEQIQL